MNELIFVQVQKDDPMHCEVFKDMILPYNREIGANMPDGTPVSDEFLLKWTQSCIDMQGACDRHLELVCINDEPIGFIYGKVDHEEHRGFIKPGYGYIMEFYVKPEHRRKGYGNTMFRHLERLFFDQGATRMYLTTGTVLGEAFWRSMEFETTGEVSPDNNMIIYEKVVSEYTFAPIQVSVDGVSFQLRENYDFSFLYQYGKVFKVFDKQSSGSLCFGVEKVGKRYFLKFAGAKTVNDASQHVEDAITRLKYAAQKYKDLKHPQLINLVDAVEVGGGYMTIFDWFDGESCGYPQHEMCMKFMALPVEEKLRVYDGILDFHAHVAACGYVAIDFNDQATLYNFENGDFAICDIDFYAKQSYMNGYSGIWGDPSLMSPEESRSGAIVDEVSNVYAMGATAFVFFAKDDKNVREKWVLNNELYAVAKKAISSKRGERYQTLAELIAAWNTAKKNVDIQYRQMFAGDIVPDMLKHFNRYQKVEKSWQKQNGEWVLVDNPYIENWDGAKKNQLSTDDFPQIINSGGALFCAFDGDKLIGFCGIDGNFIGSSSQYLWLVYLHVSYEYRGKGIGRKLFLLTADAAKKLGARKLYISANSSKESQAFYRSIGCVDTEEIVPDLFEAEPYDVHMEYVI